MKEMTNFEYGSPPSPADPGAPPVPSAPGDPGAPPVPGMGWTAGAVRPDPNFDNIDSSGGAIAGSYSDPNASQPPAAEDLKQYCIFRAGRERFCLPVLDIEEVVEWPLLTRVPLAPGFLMGIFSLRGGIVPVIDIAFTEGRRADLPPKHVIVTGMHDAAQEEYVRLGIAVDEIIGTYTTADPLLVEEAPKNVPHCIGMLQHDSRLALALDLRKLKEAFPVPVI